MHSRHVQGKDREVQRNGVIVEDGGTVEDQRLLLIRRARSSRQAVKAKQPWQLIASSSCQVPLGNRLKLQSDYFFCSLMHVSGRWTYLSTRQDMLFFFFLSQGLGGKPGPRGQRGPTVGLPAAPRLGMHPPRQ